MKTLIIHPNDSSTKFLETIYSKIVDKTVVTGGESADDIIRLIESHDRVMMMGHGSPYGLFSMGNFNMGSPYVINYMTVPLLRKKDNSVFIWCNADEFVNRYELKGFYSGMFISEVEEAEYCRLYATDQELVDESNDGFCEILSRYVDEDKHVIYENVKKEYGVIAELNPVALYNNNRLYIR